MRRSPSRPVRARPADGASMRAVQLVYQYASWAYPYTHAYGTPRSVSVRGTYPYACRRMDTHKYSFFFCFCDGAIYMTYSVGLRRYIDNPKIVSKIEPLSEAAERPLAREFSHRGNSSHISNTRSSRRLSLQKIQPRQATSPDASGARDDSSARDYSSLAVTSPLAMTAPLPSN